MIRETLSVTVPSSGDDVRRAVTQALSLHGFDFARHEHRYVEARRGTVTPMRLVSRMKIEDTPIVVCVAIEETPTGGSQIAVGAYPDLGPAVFMGPIARRKWRAAMVDAVAILSDSINATAGSAPQSAA